MAPQQVNNIEPSSSSDLKHESSGERNKLEVYYEGNMYDVTDWVSRHPGGSIIKFYTKGGEDATIPIQQFHNRSMKKTLAIMKSLKKRPATPKDLGLSGDAFKRHQAMTEDFQKLHQELEAEGFFKPSPAHLAYRLTELALLFIIGTYAFTSGQYWWSQVIGVLCVALFAGRCGWLMHEGGHHSMTGNSKLDRFVQSFLFGFGSGMSAVWWSSQHNRHHAMPQRLHHDVDLDTMPLLAFNKKVVKRPQKDGQGFLIRHQATLFALIDTFLVAWFWKLYLHPRYAVKRRAYSDLFFMSLHYIACIYLGGIWAYLVAVWLSGTYIFVNFAVSHTHLPVTEEPRHWLEYSLLHTANIDDNWFVNWWMSYLNFQIEHHLFPTMPQFRHPLVKPRVQALARKHNIPYYSYSYTQGIATTFRNLAKVSKQLKEEL